MEENTENMKVTVKRKFSRKKIVRNVVLGTLATIFGYIHYEYVITLFENHRNFSYLSNLEREMSFLSETGFYYSYYKTVVEEKTLVAGVSKIMYDKQVEYPKEVNSFNRFNIYPEVLIGSVYRYLRSRLVSPAYRQCHLVHRDDLPPVHSCVGIGEPVFFYLQAVWILAGVTVAIIFLFAVSLSESILGGFLATAQYFANHSEATRVMWSPNQRENFALPLLLLQSWFLVLQLRYPQRKTAFQLQVSIFILNCLCLLAWQFTQFIFLTQTAIFFVMEQLKIIDKKSLCIFLHCHFCSLHMAVVLLQGNDMLKSSLYISLFIVVSVYCLLFSSLRVKVQTRLDFLVESWLVILRIAIVISFSLYLKKFISDFLDVDCDNHVWDILLAKLTDYKSFNTMVFTCIEAFDFMSFKSFLSLTQTSLLPLVLLTIINMVCYWLKNALDETEQIKTEKEDDSTPALEKDSEIDEKENTETVDSESKCRKRKITKTDNLDVVDEEIKPDLEKPLENSEDKFLCFVRNINIDPGIFYCLAQLGVFGILALLIMRLKLLFVPQMCIVASLAVNLKYYTIVPRQSMKVVFAFWVIVAIALVTYLVKNLNTELDYLGEFQSPHTEELMYWILNNTLPTSSFAASLPLLATIMLTTRRPIAAHPHYEHSEARQRGYLVYKAYGRFVPEDYYRELSQLQVSFLVVERIVCYGRMNSGCSFTDMWDVEYPSLKSRPRLCHTLFTEPVDHFYPIYKNPSYSVFKLHDLSVQYMPRSFDS